jgi:hypothetical protein
MEPVSLTAGAILTLGLTKVFETSIEKFTEAGLVKIDRLRQKIWDKFRGNTRAENALAAAEQGSKADLDKVAAYLQGMMNEEPDFAQEIQALAREIEAGKIEDNSQMNQVNRDTSRGVQVKNNSGQISLGDTHNYHA